MNENVPAPEAPAKKKGVPVWGQVLIWVGLFGLLAAVGLGMRRTREGPIQVGDKVRDFTLTTFDNYTFNGQQDVKLSDLKGKVVVVNFWASWCQPCKQEAAFLENAWQSYKPDGDVVFLGVDYLVPQRPRPGDAHLATVPHAGRARNVLYRPGRCAALRADRPLCQHG
jgi:thiol-disulfide isomerase/thioredoxin